MRCHMRVSTMNNKIKRNISYKDFIRNENGELKLKDKFLLTTMRVPDMVSYSVKGIR